MVKVRPTRVVILHLDDDACPVGIAKKLGLYGDREYAQMAIHRHEEEESFPMVAKSDRLDYGMIDEETGRLLSDVERG